MAKGHSASRGPRPIKLYDHIPEILVVELAVVFTVLAVFQLAIDLQWRWTPLSADTVFWLASTFSLFWAVSYRWNLSKKNFLIATGLAGTFIGIPAALEIVGKFAPEALGWFAPFTTIGRWLGAFAPRASAGAYAFVALVCWMVTALAFIWSRVHMRAKLDESGLSIKRADGKRVRYDLIGLKTEEDPFDYSERAALGIGSLTLRTRAGKHIFSMKRVIGLYRIPWLFWVSPKLNRIDEILSYQGKTTIVDASDRLDMAESLDDTADDDDGDLGDDDVHEEFDAGERDADEGGASEIH